MKRASGRSLQRVRALARSLPGIEEGTSYGTPGFRVKGKLFARLWSDLETLVVRCPIPERELLLEAAPDVFFLTDHYRDHPFVLVRIAKASPAALADAFENAWRLAAPPKLVAEHDGAGSVSVRAPVSRRPERRAKPRSRRARPRSRRD